MLRIVFFTILFTTINLLQLQAQSFEEKDFVLYTTKDGLSDNDVWSIEQDAYGYIWVATKIGLNRFDGNTFRQFYSDSSRNSMPEDFVFSIKRLNEEQLAVITQSGLHILNTRTLEGRNLIIPPDSFKLTKKVSTVTDASGDKNGNVFVITTTGFYHFNSKDELLFRYDHSSLKNRKPAAGRFGYNIIMVENNTLLLSTGDGPYIYYVAQKDLHPVSAKDDIFYQGTVVTKNLAWFVYSNEKIFGEQTEDGKDLYWFDIRHKTKQIIPFPFETKGNFDETNKLLRLNDSLFVMNGRVGFYLIHKNGVTNSYQFSPKQYFENYFCASLLVDKNGRLWVATDRGLFRQKRSGSSIEQASVQQQANFFNKGTAILSMAIANNKIFAGTLKEGLFVFDRDSLKLIRKIDFSKDKNILVKDIIAINNDTLFIAPSASWVNARNLDYGKINLPNWELHNIITKILKDPLDNIYIKNNKNISYYRSNDDKKFILLDSSNSDFARVLTYQYIDKDTEGNTWFSGSTGMLRFNHRLQKSDLLLDSFPSIKGPQKSITSNLVFDQKGNIFFGLRANGLIIYNYVQNKFSQLTRSDGLPDNNVHTIFLHDNTMWIGTESGLASYNLSTRKISSFGVADGMPPNLFTVSSFCYDPDRHQLYIAFDNTIIRFNPDRLEKNNLAPDFFIESINVTGKGKFYHPSDKFNASYKYNSLVIDLAAINFEDAYQQQFAYRLIKNGTESWQETGSQRSIIFSNLSPGIHRLQFKVYTKNNSWPEQTKEITIIVSPPFWKTTWFILLSSLLFLLSLYFLYRYRVKGIRQKANIDKQIAELEMKGLHAQMNPHFVFNSLNSIKEMILEDEKQHASRYLSKFAQLIRTNLEQSKQTFISVKQCIDHLHQYLEMEKIRFGDFTYSIDVADELPTDEIQMAPMLIQPLVENAIWHGLHNKQGGQHLAIRFYRSSRQLVCEIEDNGIGINKSKENKSTLRPTHRSLGISNIQDRLNVLNEKYKMNCSLTITDRSGLPGRQETGTLAVLRLNI